MQAGVSIIVTDRCDAFPLWIMQAAVLDELASKVLHRCILVVLSCMSNEQITKTFKMLHSAETARALERVDFVDFVLNGREIFDKTACETWMDKHLALQGGIFAANDEYTTLLLSGPAMTVAMEFYKVSNAMHSSHLRCRTRPSDVTLSTVSM